VEEKPKPQIVIIQQAPKAEVKPVEPPKKEEAPVIVAPAPDAKEPAPKPLTAKQELDAYKANMEEARAEAILRPSPESMAKYLALQERTMAQAMTFTDMWQRTRWANPELDYTFQHPVAAGAVRVDRQLTREEERAAVKQVAEQHGIFFFFKQDCKFCEEQGRVLKALSDDYKLTVVAVSLDGSSNSYFPNARRDNGISAKMGVADAPAMFIVNPDTNETMPLGYGIVPVDEIEARIRRLVVMQPGVY
jgi:conjugal transfer pilus assembly protein TraF